MHLIYVVEYPDNKYIVFRTKREVVVGSKLNSGEVIKVIKSDDQMDVDKIIKKYMMEYGIKNVQGGSYYNLKDCQIKALEHEFESLKAIVKPSEYLNKFTSIKEIDYEITFLKKILGQMSNMTELYKKRIEMLEKQLVSNDDSDKNLSSDDDTTTHSTGFSTDIEESTDEDI
jgi:hypothetical protein